MCGFGVRCVLLPAFGGDEPFRVGVGAFHVDDPFAAPSGVFCRSGRGGVELTFEVGICVLAICVPHCEQCFSAG